MVNKYFQLKEKQSSVRIELVAALCWGEWGRFRRLGWSGPSPQVKADIASN